jgi:hypothetical protein
MDGRFETYVRPDRGFAAWPTNDDLTVLICGWPYAELEANRNDIEGNYLKMLELAPAFADRVRAARREARYVGTAVPNYFRKPYGPGWALVGDAGTTGTSSPARASTTPSGTPSCASRRWTRRSSAPAPSRTRWTPTRQRATSRSCRCTSSPPSSRPWSPRRPSCSNCWRPCTGNQEAMDGFARVLAGVTSPAEFFAEENVGRIMTQAGAAAPA